MVKLRCSTSIFFCHHRRMWRTQNALEVCGRGRRGDATTEKNGWCERSHRYLYPRSCLSRHLVPRPLFRDPANQIRSRVGRSSFGVSRAARIAASDVLSAFLAPDQASARAGNLVGAEHVPLTLLVLFARCALLPLLSTEGRWRSLPQVRVCAPWTGSSSVRRPC